MNRLLITIIFIVSIFSLARAQELTRDTKLPYYAALFRPVDHSTPSMGSVPDSISGTRLFYLYRYSKLELCLKAWGELFMSPDSVLLEVHNPSSYRQDIYCYELRLPERAFKGAWLKVMRQDLEARLGVNCVRGNGKFIIKETTKNETDHQ